MIHHGSAIDVDELLEQTEAFVRAGDYLEARARAGLARDELGDGAEAATRARVARTLRRCDVLAEEWRAENAARCAAYVARERRAIGADTQEPAEGVAAWSQVVAWLRSLRGPARRAMLPAPPPPLPAAGGTGMRA